MVPKNCDLKSFLDIAVICNFPWRFCCLFLDKLQLTFVGIALKSSIDSSDDGKVSCFKLSIETFPPMFNGFQQVDVDVDDVDMDAYEDDRDEE